MFSEDSRLLLLSVCELSWLNVVHLAIRTTAEEFDQFGPITFGKSRKAVLLNYFTPCRALAGRGLCEQHHVDQERTGDQVLAVRMLAEHLDEQVTVGLQQNL